MTYYRGKKSTQFFIGFKDKQNLNQALEFDYKTDKFIIQKSIRNNIDRSSINTTHRITIPNNITTNNVATSSNRIPLKQKFNNKKTFSITSPNRTLQSSSSTSHVLNNEFFSSHTKNKMAKDARIDNMESKLNNIENILSKLINNLQTTSVSSPQLA